MRAPLELAWVWVALTVPAWPVVDRYFGIAGIVIYSIIVGGALLIAPRINQLISARRVAALGLATAAIVLVLFASIYPRVNVHQPGAGSDDDDAHNVGAMALLAGESPYSHMTYLGNELHQLPGAFVLSMPFTLLGTSALQNLVCLPLFFVLLKRATRDARTPLLMAWFSVLGSVAVLYQVVTGSSYSWNAIWVLAGIAWIVSRPSSLAAPIFLGVAMCSRANFIMLLAPLAGWLWRAHGPAIALRAIALSVIVIALLALPFYFSGTAFGPLSVVDGLRNYDAAVPGGGFGIVIGTAVVACGLALVRTDRAGLFLQCALVQAVPVAAGLILSTLIADQPDKLAMAFYGTFAAWFTVMGASMRIEPWLSSRASRQ